jgi:hypothetical protein
VSDYPKPLASEATISVKVFREEEFNILLVDLMDQEQLLLRRRLDPGQHCFVFRTGTGVHQILVVEFSGQ